MLLDSPHSGVEYPADFGYTVPLADLRRAEDTHVDDLYGFAPELGASLITANFPRSYLDANRAETDIDPALLDAPWPYPLAPTDKTRLGKGLIWRLLDDGRPLYDRPLGVDEVRHRIDTCWRPYHAAVRNELDVLHRCFGFVLHLNCHSMPSVSDKLTTDQPGQVHPDVVLGDRDGSSADPAITRYLCARFAAAGLDCRINDPYKGVELVRAYADPAVNRHAIQVELNRKLYMDERTLEPHAGYIRLRRTLETVLADLIAFTWGFSNAGRRLDAA